MSREKQQEWIGQLHRLEELRRNPKLSGAELREVQELRAREAELRQAIAAVDREMQEQA